MLSVDEYYIARSHLPRVLSTAGAVPTTAEGKIVLVFGREFRSFAKFRLLFFSLALGVPFVRLLLPLLVCLSGLSKRLGVLVLYECLRLRLSGWVPGLMLPAKPAVSRRCYFSGCGGPR